MDFFLLPGRKGNYSFISLKLFFSFVSLQTGIKGDVCSPQKSQRSLSKSHVLKRREKSATTSMYSSICPRFLLFLPIHVCNSVLRILVVVAAFTVAKLMWGLVHVTRKRVTGVNIRFLKRATAKTPTLALHSSSKLETVLCYQYQ